MKLHSRLLNSYLLLIVASAILFTGCNTGSGPSNTAVHPTPTTLATVWHILEQRPLLIPPLPQNKTCPATNDVMPYIGFTVGHPIASPGLTELPFASPKTLANGQPNPHNNGWYLQKVIWMIQSPYQGPILIRGHQIGGSHILQFNGGLGQESFSGDWANAPLSPELQIIGNAQNDAPNGWVGETRAQVPGCYIYQVDGLKFSGYFITQVVFGN